MKTNAAVLLAALLAGAAHSDRDFEQCVSDCRTQILQAAEKDCASYRSELPRPDLYNHCNHGHAAGREAVCSVLCRADHANEHHSRQLDSQRLDACAHLQGRPPSERVGACNDGYVRARTRALQVTRERRLAAASEPVSEPARPAEPVVVVKVEAPKVELEVKRKLSVNSQTSAKSLLEAAREEAAAAFQEAKSGEL